ncbi:hypothetical protein, partial [Pseudomonas fluorescens]|uniref:hypothetical protein n=1 Tax=Pseudomonas fluorescens TaxID=294 RepID=UPI001F29CD5A
SEGLAVNVSGGKLHWQPLCIFVSNHPRIQKSITRANTSHRALLIDLNEVFRSGGENCAKRVKRFATK